LFLKWSNIKLIKDVAITNIGSLTVRSFYVIPNAGVSLNSWSKRWIRFTSSMYEFSKFVDAINRQVRSHNIKIECIRGTDIVISDEISI
jgi:hypothetical protein